MVENAVEDARKENQHMVAHLVVFTSPLGKEHCKHIFINELLLCLIIDHINLTLFVIVDDAPLWQPPCHEYVIKSKMLERMHVQLATYEGIQGA